MMEQSKELNKIAITPVLLSGGSGTRLWPFSRKSYPKQFMQLSDEPTLFQTTALRLVSSEVLHFTPMIIVTNSDYRFIVAQQLSENFIKPDQILIEPKPRNTAAAILAASISAYRKDPESILLVAPTDHIIGDTQAFHKSILNGLAHAKEGKIVSFGVEPTRPETGYGYLELLTEKIYEYGASEVVNFIEKPDLDTAARMLDKGNFLWNAGIYLFKAEEIIRRFAQHAPVTLELVNSSVKTAISDLDFLRLKTEHWSQLENISIDYAIMEKIEDLVVVPLATAWSDLGDWQAVWQYGNRDASGNLTSDTAHVINCQDSLLLTKDNKQHIVGLGLKDIVAISMRDAVLVADRNSVQDVKQIVKSLKENEISIAEIFPVDHRPWGWFESLVLGDQFQVKKIFVNPGAALSLQSHQQRSEHWIVVKGRAAVTINSKKQLLEVGQSVYVPQGAIHRLENVDKDPMELIEVQIGAYLGEDDIIRYEDVYERGTAAEKLSKTEDQ